MDIIDWIAKDKLSPDCQIAKKIKNFPTVIYIVNTTHLPTKIMIASSAIQLTTRLCMHTRGHYISITHNWKKNLKQYFPTKWQQPLWTNYHSDTRLKNWHYKWIKGIIVQLYFGISDTLNLIFLQNNIFLISYFLYRPVQCLLPCFWSLGLLL